MKIQLLLFFLLFLWSCKPDEPISQPWVISSPAENVTATTATLSAYVTPNADSTVVNFEYCVFPTENWESQVVSQKFNGTKQIKVTLEVINLQPDTHYSYRVSVRNANGSMTSQVVKFVTSSYTPPVIVKAVALIRPAENVTINEARLVAAVIPNHDSTTVTFEYSTDKINWQSRTLANILSGSDSVKVTCDLFGLQANTTYSYRVKATNIAGEISSNIDTLTTYAVKGYEHYYHTVTIGTQTWLKENLKETHYLNGDPIPNLTDTTAWLHSTSGAYVYYNNDPKLGEVYGCLYNWYVTADSRGLVSGYHVPSEEEWVTLGNFVAANYSLSIDYVGLLLNEAGTKHWKFGRGLNTTGFTALPNGSCGAFSPTYKFIFFSLGDDATFWTSFSMGDSGELVFIEPSKYSGIDIGNLFYKNKGFGLRLIKN